jgi:EpsI family protein
LRYILALLALGIIFCYFFQRRTWKAAILLISLIPEAIIANALRVAAMGIFPSLQQGFWHSFSGWLIFLLCFGFLGLLNWMLNYLGTPMPAPTPPVAVTPEAPAAAGNKPPPSYLPYLISALALTLAVGPLVMRLGHAAPTPVRQSFDHFPLQLGAWEGHFAPIAPKMVRATGASAHLNAEFRNGQQGLVTLWIAYYDSQRKSAGSIHSPQYCLPGSGWHTSESGIRYVQPGFPVQYMLMEQSGARMMVYYWYLQRGRWVANEYARKFFTGYDGLVSRRNDGALIRLITPVGHDPVAAQQRLTSFARLLVPVLPQFIPD